MYCRYLITLSIVSLLFVTGCTKTKASHHSAEWNILIYMAADNNLERFAIQNIESMQKVGSKENVNIIVLLDRSPRFDKSNEDWSGTKILRITNNSRSINTDIVEDMGELDMTNSMNLYSFLNWAKDNYPAKHTLLTLWGHGRGVYPDCTIPTTKGIIEDYTTGYGSDKTMSIVNFASAIKDYEVTSNKTIDILHFDACYMQMIEVCWQIKDLTDYIVGAETAIPGKGADYEGIVRYLYDNSSVTPEDVSRFIASSYFKGNVDYQNIDNFTTCAISTKALKSILPAFNDWCNDLLEKNSSFPFDTIKSIRDNLSLLDPDYTEYVDLNELISETLPMCGESSVKLLNLLNEILIYSRSKNEFSKLRGLGINFVHTIKEYKPYLDDEPSTILDFYLQSHWDEFLNAFISRTEFNSKPD